MHHPFHELDLGQAQTIEDLSKQVTVLEALIEIEAKQLSSSFKEARKSTKLNLHPWSSIPASTRAAWKSTGRY